MTDFALTADIPLGPFEGAPITAYSAKGKNARLHATATCPQLRTRDVLMSTVPLNGIAMERMCNRCAAWGRWARAGTSLGIFLEQVGGLGLVYELASYRSDDPDEFSREQIAEAEALLRNAQSSDEEEDLPEGYWEARQLRESILPDQLWRAADSLRLAWGVISRYPWLEQWARPALDEKTAHLEDLRSSLAQFIDPRALLESAVAFVDPLPPLPTPQPALQPLGNEHQVRQVLERLRRDWRRSVVHGWTGVAESQYSGYRAVYEALGRKRKGAAEARTAIDDMVRAWRGAVRQSAAEEHGSATADRLIVASIPFRQHAEEPGHERPSIWQSLSPWQLGVICHHAVAVDWARRRVLLQVSPVIAERLLAEDEALGCVEVTDSEQDHAKLLITPADAIAVRSGVLLPGSLDDGPIHERRLITLADIEALRTSRGVGNDPYVVFSAINGVEALPLHVLGDRCARGWQGVLLAGPNDLPAAVIAPWMEQVAAARRQPHQAPLPMAHHSLDEEDFAQDLSIAAGERVLEQSYAFGFRPGDDNARLISRHLGLLAIARGVHDLRSLTYEYGDELQPIPAAVWKALLAFRQLNLRPFQTGLPHGRGPSLGLPLGTLSDAQIYTSNADPNYGKGHAASCRHIRDGRIALHPSDALLTVVDLIERQFDWCRRCGGYAVRRFNTHQLEHYRAAHRLQEISDDVSWLTTRGKTITGDEPAQAVAGFSEELAHLHDWKPDPTSDTYTQEFHLWREAVQSVRDALDRLLIAECNSDFPSAPDGKVLPFASAPRRPSHDK